MVKSIEMADSRNYELKKEIVSLKEAIKHVRELQKKDGYTVPHEFMAELIRMDKSVQKLEKAIDDGDRLWLLERQASSVGIQLAYRNIGPVSRGAARMALSAGEEYLRWAKLKPTGTGLLYAVKRSPFGHIVYFYTADKTCIGLVEMERRRNNDRGVLEKHTKSKYYMPHVVFRKDFSGIGIPTQVYQSAIRHGYGLMSDGHTKSASLLWDRVAKRTGALIRYYDYTDDSIREFPRGQSVKIMFPREHIKYLEHMFR